MELLFNHVKSLSNKGIADYLYQKLFKKQKLFLDQVRFKNKDRIETLEKQKSELKREIEEVNELMMGMSNNSQSMTSLQPNSRHQSMDEAESNKVRNYYQ